MKTLLKEIIGILLLLIILVILIYNVFFKDTGIDKKTIDQMNKVVDQMGHVTQTIDNITVEQRKLIDNQNVILQQKELTREDRYEKLLSLYTDDTININADNIDSLLKQYETNGRQNKPISASAANKTQ